MQPSTLFEPWVALGAAFAYVGVVCSTSAVTGVAHYQGRRAPLCLVEVALLAVLALALPEALRLALFAGHVALVMSVVLAPWLGWCYLLSACVGWWVVATTPLGATGGGLLLLALGAQLGRRRAAWARELALAGAALERAQCEADAMRDRSLAFARGWRGRGAQDRGEDVLNWINLTAGLTHSIGNEVLAFDHYSAVVLEHLEGASGPAEIVDAVRFIHETNRARLGFINFLQEFAEIMKLSGRERRVPVGLREIELPGLIHRVRDQVGRFESHELDPDDPDPQTQAQRRKNLELGLIVHAESDRARRLARGRQPVLEFICYEFIKNALRNCSGVRRLKVDLRSDGQRVAIRFINDLDVRQKAEGECARCGVRGELRWLKNQDPATGACDRCFRAQVEENLRHCWAPGRTSQGGKGLGLFVIQHFLTRYCFGQASAGVQHWPTHEVFFEVKMPRDLAAAISHHNAGLLRAS